MSSVKRIPRELVQKIAAFQGPDPQFPLALDIPSPERQNKIKDAFLHIINKLLCTKKKTYFSSYDRITIPFDSKIAVELESMNDFTSRTASSSATRHRFMLTISGGNPDYVHSTDKRTIPYRDGYDMDQGLKIRFYFTTEKKEEVFTYFDWLLRNYRKYINTDENFGTLCHDAILQYQHDTELKEKEKVVCCHRVDVRKNPVIQEMMGFTKIIFRRFSVIQREKQDSSVGLGKTKKRPRIESSQDGL